MKRSRRSSDFLQLQNDDIDYFESDTFSSLRLESPLRDRKRKPNVNMNMNINNIKDNLISEKFKFIATNHSIFTKNNTTL